MANEQNLKRGNPETQFTSDGANGRGAVENGKASGKSRRRTANLRKVIQSVMNRTYTDEDGKQLTGVEKLAVTLYQIAVDPSDKNCLSAMRLLIELYGEDMSPEQKRKLKAETELLKARAKKLEDDDW